MSGTTCSRCAEPLVKRSDNGLCVWCTEERAIELVRMLKAAAGSDDGAALSARATAVDRLERLGFTQQEVLRVRARVVDGHSAEEIVEGLVDGAGELAAA